LVRRMVRERLRGRDSALAPAVHRLLPAALARTGLDPAALACETIHHLGRAGEWDQAAAHLARQAGALIEQGASAELLRCLADLPPDVEARHPPLAPWRARGRLRMLELREAEAEIRRALTLPGAHRLELLLLLARVLLLHGALDEAGRTLAEAAAEPAEPAEPAGSRRAQASLAMIAAMVRCYRDDEVPAACSDLAAAAARLPDQATRLRATAASLRWLDHYGSGLVESGAAVPLEKPQRTVGLRAAALLPIATSRLGGAPGALVLETDAALRLSESRMRRHRDVLSRVHLSAVRIVRLWEQGLRVEGLAELEAAVETARRLEYRVAALWLEVWSARALFTLGRRVDAEARLAASTLQADRMGMRWIARAAAGARAQEPVARFVTMVRHGDLALAPASPRIRALAVLAAAAAGETSRVDALRRASGEEMARPGFGVERALDALAGGTLSLLRGDAEAYGQALERARAALAGDGADSDLLDRLLVVLGDVVVTASGRRIALGGSAPPSGGELRGGIVLDRETGELRAPSGVIPFARRHVLRRLLYRMALCPGEVVSKEILAQAVWDVGYHPLRHDNALFVNIHRLRVLLDGTGLEVASREDGYSLSAPPGFRFIKGVRDGPVRGSAAGRPSADR
ncbi:MAG TPA: hypothetical protein VEL05_02110, partial [Candidatus Acidoferrum sp.]|nr:hypothetical protein [Candidatus Acidoferrum sp.]